jgi:hypothetical protein
MKYCKIDANTTFKITDLNFKELALDKRYGTMKDSFNLIKSILLESFGYHDRLKTFSKSASYDQIRFPKKCYISEANVELDANSLYPNAMTKINLPKGKPMSMTKFRGNWLGEYFIFIIEVEIESLISK